MINAVAVVPPGLEPVAAEELEELGGSAIRVRPQALAFQTDLAGLYRLHLRARLPFRILRELARFPCAGRADLREGIQRSVDWGRWLPPELSLRVDVSGQAPGLNHSHVTALQVKNAVVEEQMRLRGRRSNVDLSQPDCGLHLHLSHGTAVLSLDGSCGSLHRRGWRQAVGKAPLKENLAAGLIDLTGWDGSCPLVDPLCGSGTLLLEAACRHWGRAAGLLRQSGLQHWADFDAALWQRERQEAEAMARAIEPGRPPLIGLDRDPDVLAQAEANAQRAGVAEAISWRAADLEQFVPPRESGVLVCNPPWGARLGADDGEALEKLYDRLGRVVRERCGGWQLWLLSGNAGLTRALRLKATRRIPVSAGGIDCRWLHYAIR
ncbi:class I SAM-dependent RNA methyltransferase [Synechococcus sp. RSCCF101]|uniref:THUMP domain-containing class I SAM-dependent RNA methyltransferase n=1 Tax=Synechococcus sp. RSCCF101 TaxID=2511069 RepID=UPI00124661B8|nr:class I SAM-dependent RNA methyltransferase [Synechococcus sp. RSCCF101]QEY32996.1 class I SAM-dependent RNA methyltransferase [Synechococcus sp. RSCCF101]